jgi:tripartite-type tricarboxylate transporter receptor subunit TctC
VNTFTITPALYPSIQDDAVKDFQTIGRVTNGNIALVTNTSALPVKTLDELVAAAKSKKLNYSSPGNGTPQHLAVELLGGQVQRAVLPVHTALPHAKAGKLNVIAVSGERRSVLAPDSPSFGALGLKNLDIDLYFWMAGPAGLPRDILDKWNKGARLDPRAPRRARNLPGAGHGPRSQQPGRNPETNRRRRRALEKNSSPRPESRPTNFPGARCR